MLVSDLALRVDPTFNVIAESWVNDFQGLTNAFAAAWCKFLESLTGSSIFTYYGKR